ncbi:SDR family oxidoreductase [Nocardiopsis sp. HNM0947]|uniref:SDR family oxidoreductase n=1 Tax=Nocardiopsis coralli TaxID=2772213 RepID=A0ABR9PD59_9ACTN|nr:SDR family oxidoreductase [Nocardiopsis coralli]MBE3001770.1 SDR family oxidoreductase [Nocardiopsis coralli]
MTSGDAHRLPDPARDPLPLRGRAALVTGASRRDGIGFATARRLSAYGASVMVHHFLPHDAEMPWGTDDLDAVLDALREVRGDPEATVAHVSADMADPGAPARVVDAAFAEFGRLDVLVSNHARNGGDAGLADVTPEMLDGHWAVDARSAILLAQAFAARRATAHADPRNPAGRLVLMTSGQMHGGMPGEIAYVAAKGAIAQLAPTLAAELGPRGITANVVDPGPVPTGYMSEDDIAAVTPQFALGRMAATDDPARLVAWLATDEASWVTGQVISADGGFSV